MSESLTTGWTSVKSGELFDFNNGKAFYTDGYSDSGFRVIDLLNIELSGKLQVTEKDKFVSADVYAKYPKAQLKENDLIIIMTDITPSLGLIGKTAIIDRSNAYVLNQRVGCLRPKKDNISIKFMNYMFNSDEIRYQVVLNTLGTAQFYVNTPVLKNLEIKHPPLPEQQKIAAILTSVDDVIESTQAQINKLKDLKTGMMQELLIKGIGHTEFKDSPVGKIPKAWTTKKIQELATYITSGSRGWAEYYSDKGAIFIRIGNLTREHINFRFNDIVYVNPPEGGEGKRTLVQVGDVLISITADLGIIGVVNESIGEAYVNQHVSLVRLNDIKKSRWVGHYLSHENAQKQFTANNDSGAKAGLNLTSIRNLDVALPPDDERDKIVNSLDSIDLDIVRRKEKLVRFIELKKALMQDLLTGKVRVNVN